MQRIPLAALAASLGFLGMLAPAGAQDAASPSADDRINALIIYGDDPCPTSTAAEITVCARKDEGERYRIPEILRESQSPQNDAWNNRVLAYETVLDSGTLSCSPAGAGGWTGCTRQMIQQAYAEKQTDASVRFSELIADERAKRLSTIDDTAAQQQQDVEAAEREYFERSRAGDAAPGEADAPKP